MKRIAAAALLALAAACSQQSDRGESETAAQGAPGDGRLFGRERFTMVMKHTGAQTGTTTTHVRDWGRRQATITDQTMRFGGTTTRMHTRVIVDGPRVTMIDLETGRGTTLPNPLLEKMANARGADYGERLMTTTLDGAKRTGRRGSFKGQRCDYYEMATGAGVMNMCVTPWGATIGGGGSIEGASFEATLVELRLNDGGPDEAFVYEGAVSELPNLQELQDAAKGAEGMLKEAEGR